MQTYVILRRAAWETEEDLDAAAAMSTQVGDEEMSDQVKWIRSYVLEEEDGSLGTVCIYQAVDEDAIMEHAQRAELPADEVIPVANTVIIRDDP
jgi:thiamine biosynthesis protein ThiC